MKECPNCRSIFEDDMFFCLQDGAPLRSLKDEGAKSAAAPTVPIIEGAGTLPTEKWPRIPQEPPRRSLWPFVAIGLLLFLTVGLAAAMFIMNRELIFGPAETEARKKDVASPTPTPQPTRTSAVPSPSTSPSPERREPKPRPTYADPAGHWKGEWSTRSGTLLDIVIDLKETQNYILEGKINWTLRRTVREDKMDKIGLSAIEYVRGTYDPEKGTITMSGYRKDDPNNVLVMLDDYRLSVSTDGKRLTGTARNGGRWNGYLNLAR